MIGYVPKRTGSFLLQIPPSQLVLISRPGDEFSFRPLIAGAPLKTLLHPNYTAGFLGRKFKIFNHFLQVSIFS